MSFASDNLVIGLEVEGTIKQLTNIDAEEGTYEVVDTDGEVFPVREAIPVIRKLRENEPEKVFIAIAV